MKDLRNKKGFTLAELLLVVAIIAVLAGIAFIAVNSYSRVLKHVQYDETAKEIFISAQNHLSMAYEEGYLNNNITSFGQLENSEKTNTYNPDLHKDVYYFVINSDDHHEFTGTSMLDIMLPFGAVDETIRLDGSYVIRYCPDTADILDVFYSDKADTKYGFTFEQLYGYNPELMDVRGEDSKNTRRNYINNKVVGYFGGDSADLIYGDEIEVPYMRVINEEKLKVIVRTNKTTDTNQLLLKLYITGDISNKTVVENVKDISKLNITQTDTLSNDYNEYVVVLDAITDNSQHFANLYSTLTPGENISVYVEASNNSELTNIAKSIVVSTNSLYGDDSTVTGSNPSKYVADITNFRHLENLDAEVSNLNVTLNNAVQSVDLDWNDFLTKTNGNSTIIYGSNGTKELKTNGLYFPVDLPTNYEGKFGNTSYPTISNVKSNATNSGLFSIVNNKDIKNIELYNFDSRGTNAGVLAGQLTSGSEVTNVLAWGEDTKVIASIYGGGLVGYSNNSAIYKSAASAEVSGNYAGGLVGRSVGSEITYSYASAHVLANGSYDTSNTDVGNSTSTYAGGLIGYSESTVIRDTYSTCSVEGKTAGGLVGYYSGSPITYSYATGYVKGNNVGTFIGNDATGSAHTNNYYLMITNDHLLTSANGMRTIGNKETNINGIKAIDESTSTYRSFINSSANAEPYQNILKTAYKGKYLFRSIEQLRLENVAIINESDYVIRHYGDWPSYETLIINTAS